MCLPVMSRITGMVVTVMASSLVCNQPRQSRATRSCLVRGCVDLCSPASQLYALSHCSPQNPLPPAPHSCRARRPRGGFPVVFLFPVLISPTLSQPKTTPQAGFPHRLLLPCCTHQHHKLGGLPRPQAAGDVVRGAAAVGGLAGAGAVVAGSLHSWVGSRGAVGRLEATVGPVDAVWCGRCGKRRRVSGSGSGGGVLR